LKWDVLLLMMWLFFLPPTGQSEGGETIMKSELLCVNCGHQMLHTKLPKYVVNTYLLQPVVCLDVPVEKCPNCGEIYFPAEVAELFEEIRSECFEIRDKITMEIPACSLDLALAG